MKFGRFPLSRCEGAILAHRLRFAGGTLAKGRRLSAADIERLGDAGLETLTVARLDPGDIGEDEAAARLATALGGPGIEASSPGTGRVNLHAGKNGVFRAVKSAVDRINAVDPGITLATLADFAPVTSGRMVATVKIIPYAVGEAALDRAVAIAEAEKTLHLAPYRRRRIGVISTKVPALKEKTIAKTLAALEKRLAPTGSVIADQVVGEHETEAVERELRRQAALADMIILFGASAISDTGDVIPAALRQAGGTITRFGMPVDPGNLMLLGSLGAVTVIGAPGCARSPAENGFDWVLHRLLADIETDGDAIAGMGVGGLLMEIGSRPQPREGATAKKTAAPRVMAVLLAAGQSRRMGETNKLLAGHRGKPLVAHAADAALGSAAMGTIVVTGHESDRIREALAGRPLRFVHNPDYPDGLSASLRHGILALPPEASHALILLADMPKLTSAMIDRMIETVKNAPPGTIVLATDHGKRGNPVIWPRADFEALTAISGDTGARHLVGENRERIAEVEIGEAAALDIDTPAALAAFAGDEMP